MINSRTKGHDAERKVVNMLKDAGYEVTRNLDQTRDGGHDILGLDGISMEVKRSKKLSFRKWWKQTLRQAGDKYPVLVYKIDYKDWQVVVTSDFMHNDLPRGITITMAWDDFLYYLREKL